MKTIVATATVRRTFERQVVATVRSLALFQPGQRILVALSGGPDSTALIASLTALAAPWRLHVSAVHFDHGLRGRESDEDARFVAALCAQLHVPLTIERINLRGGTDRGRSESLQQRAREARYARLRALAAEQGADRVALGHQADDQAETVLMWMMRGAGATGLTGIPPIREGLFMRPLLNLTRDDVLAYLDGRALTYRSDSSNNRWTYRRNRVRHEFLPLAKTYNPSIVRALARQADILREDDRYLHESAATAFRQLGAGASGTDLLWDRREFSAVSLAIRRRLIRLAFRHVTGEHKGPSFRAIDSVLTALGTSPSGRAAVVRGVAVQWDRASIRFGRAMDVERLLDIDAADQADRPKALDAPVPSTLWWPSSGQRVTIELLSQAARPSGSAMRTVRNRRTVWLDADRFTLDLRLRSWRRGDVFCPAGMGGHRKKLQDFLTDLKVARSARGTIPLLVAPEGILCVIGHRADHRYLAGPTTERVLRIDVE